MHIPPFTIEEYFALYEFSAPYMLAASDCESMTIGELLDMADMSLDGLANLHLGYTEAPGHPDLRRLIAEQYETTRPDNVIVAGAPEEAIFVAMHTLLDKGDEVIVLTPAYDSLKNLAQHICGKENVKLWQIQETASGWQIDLNELESLLSNKTKMLIVNFPHNPTGFLPSEAQQRELINLVKKHGTWLFCDEMYRGLELPGRETLPSAVDLYERAIILSGLSKVHGLPGLRSGWLVLQDEQVRQKIINWKHYTTICASAPSEFLAQVALQVQDKLIARNTAIIQENISVANEFFARWPNMFDWKPQEAGSIALIKINVPSATEHCHTLVKEAGVMLLPSSCVGYGDGHVRMGTGRVNFPHNLAQYEAYLNSQ